MSRLSKSIEAYNDISNLKDEEIKKLKEENRKLKSQLRYYKNKGKSKEDNSSWDFHWDGRGDYEESRRCFYGDFS